jgi:AraC-like DNA-binding protein
MPAPTQPRHRIRRRTQRDNSRDHHRRCYQEVRDPVPRYGIRVVDLTGQLSNPQPALCRLADQVIRSNGGAANRELHRPKPTRRPRFHTQRRLSADQIVALVEGYRSGKAMKELASEFGIHRTTVSTHLAEHGVSVRRGGLDQEQTAEAVRLYEEGWSSGRLGERFGVSADTILTVLRRAGVSIRPRRGGPRSQKD